jgi:toxin ParE1/3/4
MSHRIIVLDEAEDELIAAQRWYENQRAGLGQEFRKAIDEAMDRLAEAPLTASPIFNPLTQPIETRRMLVKRFPYSIIFVEYQEDLWVIAFAHNRRRPGYWRERLIP